MRFFPESTDTYQAKLATPFAVLGIKVSGNYLTNIDYLPLGSAPLEPQHVHAERVCEQITAYLDNPEFEFTVPTLLNGTPFQTKVWQVIASIPTGKTLTYTDIAEKLHSGPRAVGRACGANRIPVVIPCHRVVAKNGLGGFMGSDRGAPLAIKRWLLRHEHA